VLRATELLTCAPSCPRDSRRTSRLRQLLVFVWPALTTDLNSSYSCSPLDPTPPQAPLPSHAIVVLPLDLFDHRLLHRLRPVALTGNVACCRGCHPPGPAPPRMPPLPACNCAAPRRSARSCAARAPPGRTRARSPSCARQMHGVRWQGSGAMRGCTLARIVEQVLWPECTHGYRTVARAPWRRPQASARKR
jgi:hypothetical protein